MLRFAEATWAFYALPKPVVAAVHGHAVAGGCILALTADWRAVARGAQVGLNEVQVGVPLPWSVALLLRASVAPPFQASVALLGRNFDGEEAVVAGLADELLATDGFRAACLRRLGEFTDKDAYSFARTKTPSTSFFLSLSAADGVGVGTGFFPFSGRFRVNSSATTRAGIGIARAPEGLSVSISPETEKRPDRGRRVLQLDLDLEVDRGRVTVS